MIFTSCNKKVRYSETDQMGVVHHSNYVNYLEETRVEWLDFLGIPYHEMETNGIISPVLKVEINYLKPLFFGDSYYIVIQLVNVPKVSLEFSYEVFNQKDLLIAKADTKIAFLSKESKQLIPVPKYVLKKFSI